MPGPLPLVPTALVYVLGDLRIEPSEGQHRHTAGGFLAIPREVLALDPTREKAIDRDEPVGHRSGRNGFVLNYSGIRQQRHGRDRPDAEERQPELQVLAHCGPPSQARRFWEALLNRCYDPERCGEGKAALQWLRGSCATPPGNEGRRAEAAAAAPVEVRHCPCRARFAPWLRASGRPALQLGSNGF